MHADTASEERTHIVLARGPRCSEGAYLDGEIDVPGTAHHMGLALPITRSHENGVKVARIGEKRLILRLQKCHQPVPAEPEKWAQHAAVAEFADRRHAGEPVGAAASPAPNQVGLDLIVSMMTGQQMKTALLTAPAGEKLIARRTGSLLDSALRFFARPDEHLVANPSCRQPGAEPADFGAAFGPEPMIHRERADLAPPVARPSIGENGESEAVGTTGDGGREKRSRFETRECIERGPELAEAQRLC